MRRSALDRVDILWTGKSPDSFVELLQCGFAVQTRSGATIREVVCGGLGVKDNYLDGRINTVFLNGHPIDNVDKAQVQQDSMLSLSASMPGFVGAALRKGGLYAPMRAAITHTGDDEVSSGDACHIRVRLYNLVARELGPFFLEAGVNFLTRHLRDFFEARSTAFWQACERIVVNVEEMQSARLIAFLQASDPESEVELRVQLPEQTRGAEGQPVMNIQQVDLFKDLSPETLKEIQEVGIPQFFEKGAFVYKSGVQTKFVNILIDGAVRVTVGNTPERDHMIDRAGETFGWNGLVDWTEHSSDAHCLVPSKVFRIEVEKLKGILDKDPQSGMRFYKRLAETILRQLIKNYLAQQLKESSPGT